MHILYYYVSNDSRRWSRPPAQVAAKLCLGTDAGSRVCKVPVDPRSPGTSSLRMRRLMYLVYSCWVTYRAGISCSENLLRRRDDDVMEPTIFGLAAFLDWMVSGCAMDRSIPSLSRCCCRRHFRCWCLSSSHEISPTVATWSCALVYIV
jgi:hypothetical protein